jgi:peroxiredoxin Q/BCP
MAQRRGPGADARYEGVMPASLDVGCSRLRAAALACILLAPVALAACTQARRPDGGEGLLPVGAVAPDVRGKDADGRPVSLDGSAGHAAVVYFYPKDETPGCTTEACAFRDAWERYKKRGIMVFGVSRDTAESHAEFAKRHHLPFPLIADQDGYIARSYGVGSNIIGLTRRVTFLVGPDGRVLRVWPDVDPGVHADEVLAAAPEDATSAAPRAAWNPVDVSFADAATRAVLPVSPPGAK